MQLTFRVRAYPTKRQHAILADYRAHTCTLYNAALDERIQAYQKRGTTITSVQQQRELTELRQDPDYAKYPRRLQVWTLNLLETAYRGMFTRHRKGEKSGTPRFRSRRFWNTIGVNSPIEFSMRGRGLHHRKFFGGTLRLKPHRQLPPWQQCTNLILHRDGKRWFVHLTYEMPDVTAKLKPQRPVGIDLGLITLAMRSDGVPMQAPRQSKEDTAADLRRANRALSRCKKRSRRRQRVRARLRQVHHRIARKRQAQLHKISARLTHHFDGVAHEDLNIAGLNQGGGGGAKGRGVRKSWADRAPGKLIEQLKWKCQRDGRARSAVNPAGTRINCHRCHAAVPKTLRERMHRCHQCGEPELWISLELFAVE